MSNNNKQIFKLKYDELRDLSKCPLKYKFMKDPDVSPIKVGKNIEDQEVLNETLEKSLAYYYQTIDNNEVPNLNEMKKYWWYLQKTTSRNYDKEFSNHYKECNTFEDYFTKINGPKAYTNNNKIKGAAAKSLKNMLDRFNEEPGTPLITDWTLELKFKNLVIEIYIPVIRKNGKYIEIVDIYSDIVRINKTIKDLFFRFPLLYLAFDKISKLEEFNDINLDEYEKRIVVYKADEDKFKYPELSDYRIKCIIHQIFNMKSIIENELYFKSVGKTCKRCGYTTPCKYWNPFK